MMGSEIKKNWREKPETSYNLNSLNKIRPKNNTGETLSIILLFFFIFSSLNEIF